jgi:hypothetical protein
MKKERRAPGAFLYLGTIDRLLDHHPYPAIAARLNEQGLQSGEGKLFTARIVARLAPSRL